MPEGARGMPIVTRRDAAAVALAITAGYSGGASAQTKTLNGLTYKPPLAGGVFRIDVGLKGLPEPRFAG